MSGARGMEPAFVGAAGVWARRAALPARRVCGARGGRAARGRVEMLNAAAIADRSFQLEEMEDEASSTCALYLRRDGTVAHGRTDGPQPERVDGAWLYNEAAREIVLELERFFSERGVDFSVKRVLRGHLDAKDNDELAMFAGNIYKDVKDFEDPKNALGHFSMCIANGDLPSEDYDATIIPK